MLGMAMLRKALLMFARAAACVLACLAAWAFNATAANPRATDSRPADPLSWLHQSQNAAQKLDYSGTFVYQQGAQVRTSRITRLRTGKSVTEKLEILDGQSQETIRNGEEIVHYLPAERRIIVEHRAGERNFPEMHLIKSQELTRHYAVRQLGTDRIAGRTAVGIAFEPRDALRYGYRFWSDRSSGLLLRAQTLSEKGEVIEQIAFTQLVIGKVRASQIKTSHSNTRGWRIENSPVTTTDSSGWKAGWLPAGFKLIRTVRRVLGRADGTGESREVVQLVFSDGLAGISVFVEPWSARHEGLPLQQGSLNMLGKRHGKFWLTIVGEVPLVSIRQIAESLEFAATDPR
jgi:sigma-E factor negative regulatory protein RseB